MPLQETKEMWVQSLGREDPLEEEMAEAPLSMGSFRQEYGSGLPLSPPGDLPDPGIEPTSLISPALTSRFFTTSATWEAPRLSGNVLISKCD